MARSPRSYKGKDITITYDLGRCIHAAECVRNAPSVFDPHEKPWVNPDGSNAGKVAKVVSMCPTGALQFERVGGGPSEQAPETNRVVVKKDGPLYATGDIELLDSEGAVTHKETRIALCRCGASKNKPFCDNSHIDQAFSCSGALDRNTMRTDDKSESGPLKIRLASNGPIIFEGPVEVTGSDDDSHTGVRGALCRCGHSGNKPYCDGTHREVGFEAD